MFRRKDDEMNTIMVGLGGAVGALLRFSLYQFSFSQLTQSNMTILINCVGSLILGFFFYVFHNHSNKFYLFATTGVLSGFTTFSTFSMETITYFQAHLYMDGMLNILLSLILCIGSCFIGVWLGKAARK